MVLRGFITSEEFEGLDAILQAEYKEEGDGHVLSVKEVSGWGFGQINGLKSTASKERNNAKKYYDQLRNYKDEDGEFIDPEAAKDALANRDKYLEGSKNDKDVEEVVKERMKQTEERHRKQIATKDKKIASLTETVRTEKIDNRIKAATAKRKGKSYLPKILKNQMDMRENDAGELYEVILDDNGNPMYSVKDPDKLMDLDEHLEIMANDEDTADLFEGSGLKGTGTRPGEKDKKGDQGDGNKQTGKPRTIKYSDQESIQKYQEEIAAGDIEVVEG